MSYVDIIGGEYVYLSMRGNIFQTIAIVGSWILHFWFSLNDKHTLYKLIRPDGRP